MLNAARSRVAVSHAGESVLLQADACGELRSAALHALGDDTASKKDLANALSIIHGGLGIIEKAAADDGTRIRRSISGTTLAPKSGIEYVQMLL
jgi:hypothetical protein